MISGQVINVAAVRAAVAERRVADPSARGGAMLRVEQEQTRPRRILSVARKLELRARLSDSTASSRSSSRTSRTTTPGPGGATAEASSVGRFRLLGRGPDRVLRGSSAVPRSLAAVRVRLVLRRRGTGSLARAAVRRADAAAPRYDADDRRLLREVLAIYGRAAVRSRQRDASYLRRSRQAAVPHFAAHDMSPAV